MLDIRLRLSQLYPFAIAVCCFGFASGCGSSKTEQTGSPPSIPDPDPDGDKLLANDQQKWVADVPSIRFSFEDIEMGIDADTELIQMKSDLIIRKRDFQHKTWISDTESETHQKKRRRSSFAFRGGAIAGPLNLRFRGFLQSASSSAESRYLTEHIVSRKRLRHVAQSYKHAEQKKKLVKIGNKAGYINATVGLQNDGDKPCQITDFNINVLVNGQRKWTFPASQAGFRPMTLDRRTISPQHVVLSLKNIKTEQMVRIIQSDTADSITFEVPPATIKPTLFELLDSVRQKCVQLELVYDDHTRLMYISTLKGSENKIPFQELLERIPNKRLGIRWATGPHGDYLPSFLQKDGCAMLLPDRGLDGRWFVFHQQSGEGLTELQGKFRVKLIAPGEYVRIQYATTRDYWGNPDQWKGHAKSVQNLRNLADREWAFWAFLESIDPAKGKDFNAATRQRLRKDARTLHRKYKALFTAKDTSPQLKALFPNARAKLKRFADWFCGTEFRFPKYEFRFKGADVYWNVDKELSPSFTLSCNRHSITADQFDSAKKGGEIRFKEGAGRTIEWTPFSPVMLHVTTPKQLSIKNFHIKTPKQLLPKQDLVHVRLTGLRAIQDLFQEVPLERIKQIDGDPELSKIQLNFEPHCKHVGTGKVIRIRSFREHFDSLCPTIALSQLPLGDLTAVDFYHCQTPRAYRQAAVLYADLYEVNDNVEDLAYSAICYFRSFSFQRAATIAEKVLRLIRRGSVEVTAESLLSKKYGLRYSYLRTVRDVALCATQLSLEDRSFNALVRCLLLVQSTMRLDRLHYRPETRNGLTNQQLRRWKRKLTLALESERKKANSVPNEVINRFLTTRLDQSQKLLKTIDL